MGKKDTTLTRIGEIYRNESLQFKLDSGLVMGNITVNVDNKIGLRWHAVNTSNVTDFITSVSSFTGVTGKKLTDGDMSRLKATYEKNYKS
jgi:hypothetical protein